MCKYIILLVPEDAHSFEVQENPVEGGNHVMMLLGVPDYACVFSKNIPNGEWKIIGLSSDIKENKLKHIILKQIK